MKHMAMKKSLLLAAALLASPLIALSAARPAPGAASGSFDALERAPKTARLGSVQLDLSTGITAQFDLCDPFGWGWTCNPHGGR